MRAEDNKTIITPHAGMRLVVALVGKRNAGKSSLINALTGQEVAIVSDEKGTTTDAVVKAYELIPVGPISLYDTAGFDDDGKLGALRVKATLKVLMRSDLALLVIGKEGISSEDTKMIAELSDKHIPFIPVFNFGNERELTPADEAVKNKFGGVLVSAKSGYGIQELKEKMIEVLQPLAKEETMLGGLIKPRDVVLLVTPIDLAAPKGRLIMPQVQLLREVLDADAEAIVVKENDIEDMLSKLVVPPALVVTDSQVVHKVANVLPLSVPLTTFSTLLAHCKGDFKLLLDGVAHIDKLKDGDKVLIAEGCSHRTTCDDIGRIKLPAWLQKYTGKKLAFDFMAGGDFAEDLTEYALVIHCGGCVLNRMEIKRRLNECARRGVKVTNYGIAISKLQGVLDRVIAVWTTQVQSR